MLQGVLWWCELADPLLCANPLWFKVMAIVSPFIYAPFFLVALVALVKGWEAIRVPLLAVALGLFYSLTVILVEQVWGPSASHNVPLIFSAYTAYWLLPIFLWMRFGFNPHPFTVLAQKKKSE